MFKDEGLVRYVKRASSASERRLDSAPKAFKPSTSIWKMQTPGIEGWGVGIELMKMPLEQESIEWPKAKWAEKFRPKLVSMVVLSPAMKDFPHRAWPFQLIRARPPGQSDRSALTPASWSTRFPRPRAKQGHPIFTKWKAHSGNIKNDPILVLLHPATHLFFTVWTLICSIHISYPYLSIVRLTLDMSLLQSSSNGLSMTRTFCWNAPAAVFVFVSIFW